MSSIQDRLRAAILGLEISPGERLSERGLEERFAASRTPVRAALLRLEAESLVARDGRHWIAAPIDLGEIAALMEYREGLEGEVVRLACRRASHPDLAALGSLLDEGEPGAPREAWHRIGTEFHVALARLSGNRFLAEAVSAAMTRLDRPRWLEVATHATRAQAWAEHRRILSLILAGAGDDAADAARHHVRRTADALLAALAEDRRGLRARGFAVIGAAARGDGAPA
ncbi:MAG: GntR family transcriptional regulator [Rhodospirillales bacterium]|nr:GntR family transcriptional regulator [Rhodospirillales bacterium]